MGIGLGVGRWLYLAWDVAATLKGKPTGGEVIILPISELLVLHKAGEICKACKVVAEQDANKSSGGKTTAIHNRTEKETEQLLVTQWGVLKTTQEKSFLSMLVLP